ncbi:Tc toxin subunit A [Pseudomonas moorei]|uniref:Tc toxin subunit A-related protein n=1 Tax=Pseudomonas moorei TaxID=395599 RepID=UPI00200F3CE3|nr:Tc toxin subunit A [Pseudomonas moorei]
MVDKSEVYGIETPFAFNAAILSTLGERGCRSIFDILSMTRGQFVKDLSSFDENQVNEIYDFAKSRAQILMRLYRALQSRNEPIMQNLPKMGVSPQPEALSAAMRSALNGAPDFSELFPERSIDGYAEAVSIQSLFSPGRYLVELYKIARGLHKTISPLQIDNRRPDIGQLILNEVNMNQRIPTLGIANQIMKKKIGSRNIRSTSTLEDTYYPMTLPYDDNLTQIRSVCAALKASLQTIWVKLGDAQWTLFQPINYQAPNPAANNTTPSPFAREQLELAPNAYNLLTSEPANEAKVKTHYNLTASDNILALKAIPLFTDRTQLTFNQLIEMTAQLDYQTAAEGMLSESRYYAYLSSTPAAVSVYGQTYLANTSATPTPMLVGPIADATAPDDLYDLNFTQSTVVPLADRAERLLRLQRKLGLEYPLLDWLIKNINEAIGRASATGGWKLDTPVLNAIAEFSRLTTKYSISSDTFSCFIGTMNTYATKYNSSMFETLFTSRATGVTASLTATINFAPTAYDPNAVLICGGLGVSANDLYMMAQLAFGTNAATSVTMNASKYAQLYRQAMIPHMLGMSFQEARTLWQLLDPDEALENIIAGTPTLETLEIIQQTEAVLAWMDTHKLDVTLVAAMTATVYSTEATPEIFNFLNNIYVTLSSDPTAMSYQASEPLSPSMNESLYRIIAGMFQVKANVMSELIGWLDLYFQSTAFIQAPYGLGDFWAEIDQLFSDPDNPATVERLTLHHDLVRYSNALGQFTLIAQWAGLTQQDLILVVTTPSWFLDNKSVAPFPSLPVLLMLSRLKEWQQQVASSEAEALNYFNSANQPSQDSIGALTLLAYIQGWETKLAQEMNACLVEMDIYEDFPKTFQQLNRLVTWMQTSQHLGVGSTCINDLYKMSLSDNFSESPILIQPVAQSLMASIQNQTDKDAIQRIMESRGEAYAEQYLTYYIPDEPANGVAGVPLSEEIKTSDDLSEYLLIDVQVSADVVTTLVAEAISSLQLYINRCLGGYDPAVDNEPSSTMVEESKPGGFLYDWNNYNQAYSTWAGKERLQYYPSIYITPSLRYTKTSLFIALEQTINQGKISTNRVVDAFTEYLTAFEALSNLETISGYQAGLIASDESKDKVFFVGRSKDQPYTYYYRRCNMAVRSDPDSTSGSTSLTAGSWSEWIKISTPNDSDQGKYLSAFWCESRLYTCWLESQETDTSTLYTIVIYYHNSDGQWSSFRRISVPPHIINPRKVSGAYDHSNKNYVIFVESTEADETTLFAYIQDFAWEIAGYQRAPEGFIYRDTNFNFAARMVQEGDKFYVGADLCTVYAVSTNNIQVSSDLSEMFYTKYNEGDNIISGPTPASKVGALFTLQYDADTAYIKITNSQPPELKLYTKSYLSRNFAAEYFSAESFSFTKDYFRGPTFPLSRISTNSGPFFYSVLESKNIDGLLSYATQNANIEPVPGFGKVPINFDSAYGVYFWEIFFYISFLIADRYLAEQNYENAALWYQYIFSGPGYRDSDGELETIDGQVRYWNVVPLQTDVSWNSSPATSVDPDAIAMNDPMNFKMAIFLKVVNLLIQTGDNYYRQLEKDMLAKAKMYYIEAAQMLGTRPVFDINNSWPNSSVSIESASVAVMDFDNPDAPSPTYLTEAFQAYLVSQNGNFLPPYNEDLLKYWDTVELRLYNLRHNLSITGQPLSLPIYATPVSPEELQRKHGVGDGSGGNSVQVIPFASQFRFVVLLEKARTAVNSVIQFGAELLSTLEKSDNEKMTLMLQTQQKQILAQTRSILSSSLDVQKYALIALEKALKGAQDRLAHYDALYKENISPGESDAMNLLVAAGALQTMSLTTWTIAAALDSVPNIYGLATGGAQYGAITRAIGLGFQTNSQIYQNSSSRISISEQYRRRREEWSTQKNSATNEVAQLEAQIQAQTQQITMAEKQLVLNELEQANQQAIYNLQITRFTGEALYNWMVGRLSALYYQLYDVTLPLCLTAKAALNREIGADKTNYLFITPMWNDLYQGLLAGEGLLLELTRMERAYLQYDRRGLEIQKTVSLNTLIISDPITEATFSSAVADAIETELLQRYGDVTLKYDNNDDMLVVTLNIASLALDTIYNNSPLTSIGRFKTISVTLPTLLGPYQDVEATLQLHDTLIALSRGLDDSGLFVLDYNDPKYFPFEGDPVNEGTLQLTFYKAKKQQAALVNNLVDVIYQLRYTLNAK